MQGYAKKIGPENSPSPLRVNWLKSINFQFHVSSFQNPHMFYACKRLPSPPLKSYRKGTIKDEFYGNCFVHTEPPCRAILGSEGSNGSLITQCHKSPGEEMHLASYIGVPGLVPLCGPPAAAVGSQRERVAVAHSDAFPGPSEASWWRAGCGIVKVLPLPLREAA